MPKKRKPKVRSLEDLQSKGTKELLGYLKRLHQCEESFELSDLYENPDLTDDMTIYFKDTAKWKEAYRKVKGILDKREHIHNY